MQLNLFTSIPARLSSPQLAQLEETVKLWNRVGATLVSVNFTEEANEHPLLANNIGVSIVDCGPRSHSKYGSRHLVPIDILAKVIHSRTHDCQIAGIINADIRPNLLYNWQDIFSLVNGNEVHIFKRLEDDCSSMQWEFDPFAPYVYGYDMFLFDITTLPPSIHNPELFCFGVPWWDYWFPLMLKAEHGFKVISHDRPLVLHATHKERFTQHDWHAKADYLRAYLHLHDTLLKHPKQISIPVDPILFCKYCVELIDSQTYQDNLRLQSDATLEPGVSIVSACMNRNSNLVKCLPSWLEQEEVSEIIIVDWSSAKPVAEDLLDHGIDDQRITIFRVENKATWILSSAFNYGLSKSRYSHTLKLDADIILEKGFFSAHSLTNTVFYAGNWRTAKSDIEKRVNGSFLAPTTHISAVGYYNEYIITYGWDDCDLYERLENLLEKTDFNLAFISHIEQDDDSRLINQCNKLGLNPLLFPSWLNQDIETRVNQIVARLSPRPHLNFGASDSWLTLVRLIGYRYTLLLKLCKPWKDGGIHLSFKILSMLSDFALASLLSFRNNQVAWSLAGSDGSNFIQTFLRFHPVPCKDYTVLATQCPISTHYNKPLICDTNDFAFPILLILRQASSLSRNQCLRALSVRPFYRILVGSLKHVLCSKDQSAHTQVSRIAMKSINAKFTSITVCVKSHIYHQGFFHDLSQILLKHGNNYYFTFIATPSADLQDVNPFIEVLDKNPAVMDLILLSWEPGLYNCWNIVCKETRSRYIGNWNCDDRRSESHIKLLCDYLDDHPTILGASTALLVSRTPPNSFLDESNNSLESWFTGKSFKYNYRDMYQLAAWEANSTMIVSQNFMHCLPIWRKAVHDLGQFFNEINFGSSADWELWMRLSKMFSKQFFLHGEPLALYYLNPISYGRKHDSDDYEKNINLIYLSDSKVVNALSDN